MSDGLKTYSELIQISDYEDRIKYLKTGSRVGEQTFGGRRYLNQNFYRSKQWKDVRRKVIIRDGGCDLADPDRPYFEGDIVVVHHMNEATIEDLLTNPEQLLNPEYLISCLESTHNRIHYEPMEVGLIPPYKERTKGDTKLW